MPLSSTSSLPRWAWGKPEDLDELINLEAAINECFWECGREGNYNSRGLPAFGLVTSPSEPQYMMSLWYSGMISSNSQYLLVMEEVLLVGLFYLGTGETRLGFQVKKIKEGSSGKWLIHSTESRRAGRQAEGWVKKVLVRFLKSLEDNSHRRTTQLRTRC